MTIRRLLLPALVLGALALTACGQGADDSDALDGEWIAISGMTDDEEIVLIEGSDVTLSIEGDQVGGQAACNSYQGTAAIEDGALVVSELMWTEMGCDPSIHEVEQAFLAALGDGPAYAADDDTLTLTGAGDEWVFVRIETSDGS